jgi:alpha-amylase/alpha-mannosidase (GH57 family)
VTNLENPYICIHGHFYQPPRENPWTGEIELQDSAKPYHDWNERIYHECYKANAEAEIIDDNGKILVEVNNYELINFNFGPTLLAWIHHKHPETYRKITEADRKSVLSHNGHGNAIAMCYNHMIMPLANLNDKITQVKWGKADFRHHFGREPEGMWLPETACNFETLEVLISEGIKYIILDTSQAAFIRKSGDIGWKDVSSGSIDPKIPYRCFSMIHPGKFINIFFYNGPVSKSVAFDDVLRSSQNLLNKIKEAASSSDKTPELISIATDGETFGHHKKHAERTLAFFMRSLVPQNRLNVVNFGEYLELHPPQYEVRIKAGEDGEGTSWSCVHGVKRWKEDCGCGGGGEWIQQWRKPLRESMDWLRDQLIIIYENIGSIFFKNVWEARNDYINVLLDNSLEASGKFFKKNGVRQYSENEKQLAVKLLEMQRFSMLMFTSCGWFFSEISGLETVKILEYASRAMELAREICGIDLEGEFIKKLDEAKSNLPKYKTGKGVYIKLVKPHRPETFPQAVSVKLPSK